MKDLQEKAVKPFACFFSLYTAEEASQKGNKETKNKMNSFLLNIIIKS
jgi:hypothetical protein